MTCSYHPSWNTWNNYPLFIHSKTELDNIGGVCVQQPKSKIRLSSSLILNHLFCAYPKCLCFDRAEQAGISLQPQSPRKFTNCFCPPLTLPEESDLTIVLSEQTYWIRLHRKCSSWLPNIPKEKEIAVVLLSFIHFWAIRKVSQERSLPQEKTDIFLTSQETVFFVYMTPKCTVVLEVTVNPWKEMQVLFLYGRESMGSSTRDTFGTYSIQEPPKHNNSLWLNPRSVDSDHGYLALTILAIFAPGGYNQLAKGSSDNFEAG